MTNFLKKFKRTVESKKLIFLIGALLLINLVILGFGLLNSKRLDTSLKPDEKNLEVIFLNVGQGDATLIKTPLNQNILIDGGPDKGIVYKLDQFIPLYNRKIDLMILTHPDPDHLNGLIEVIRRYPVNYFIYNGVIDESYDYKKFLEELDNNKVNKEIVWNGKKINFDGGEIDFLYPLNNLMEQNLKDDNEGSLIFKLNYGQIDILFTGDATAKIESQLLEKNAELKSDLLKIAHHGSKYSSSINFLKKVEPSYAIISVGKNGFGHPSLRVLRNLQEIGAKTLRTDQLNDIIFTINKNTFLLINQVNYGKN